VSKYGWSLYEEGVAYYAFEVLIKVYHLVKGIDNDIMIAVSCFGIDASSHDWKGRI
jgi:6-phosphofructokinase